MNVLFSGLNSVLQEEDIDYLTKIGFNLAFKSKSEDLEDPTWPEVIVTYRFTQSQPISKFPNLKYIQTPSAGFNHLDLDYIKENNISLHNARGVHGIAISEYVLGKILEVYKNSKYYQKHQENKTWDGKSFMKALYLRKAAVLGTGSIGQEIAKRLQVFGVEVTGFNSNGRDIEFFDQCHPLTSFSEHAKIYDIVIVALPLNEQTEGFLNRKRLLSMNRDAILINIGRGKLIDEATLISLLDTQFLAVILDVFEVEPLPQESPLWHHPKVTVTPHNSSQDPTTNLMLRNLILDNLSALAKNEELANKVIL